MSTGGPDDATRLERLVTVVRTGVAAVLAELPDRPTSINLAAADVRLEICWPGPPAPAPAAPATPVAAPPVATQTPAVAKAETQPDDPAGIVHIGAPSVGTFYRAPEPGAAPFVQAGDLVTPGQQVGIVETMKLMIPVEAERRGRVVEVLVADGKPVEYGDPLVAVAPE